MGSFVVRIRHGVDALQYLLRPETRLSHVPDSISPGLPWGDLRKAEDGLLQHAFEALLQVA